MTAPPATVAASRQPPRVLHVVTSDAYAGIERHLLNLAANLRQLGCAAEIACPPTASRIRDEAASHLIPVLPAGDVHRRSWLAAVARSVRRTPPDIVHVHDGRAAIVAAALAPLSNGASFVRTQHFSRPASVERPGLRSATSIAAHRFLNRKLSGYIAVSEAAAHGARERDETAAADVVVIPPGIRLPTERDVAEAVSLRRDARSPVIAFIGRLEPEKRVDVLVRAVPELLRRVPGCHIVIAGTGSVEAELKGEARRLGIESAITWKGWVAEPDEILKHAHVYVNTILWEGFGMAMAEAMAYGLPVVAVDSGASTELVVDGVTGRLARGGDADALADAVGEILENRDAAAAMGTAARAKAVAEYGTERTARDTLALYERLLGAGAAR